MTALREHFERVFGAPPAGFVRAPGRVNLIGEHTDYNDGFVLPAAIERDVLMAVGPSGDSSLTAFSVDFDRHAVFDVERLEPNADEPWSNYIAGAAWALSDAGHRIGGAHIALQSTIPPGSGLSSSAALELATALGLQTLFDLRIERPALAKLCQRAENAFVGMPCGIMDQFIAALGRERHALLLDCRSLDYEYVPVSAASLVIAHSGVRRELVGSEYRERRAQCESAVAKLAPVLPGISALRDVSSAQLEEHAQLLAPVELRRARHVVTEDERTLQAVRALKDGNLDAFGELMVASHHSLRDDYEVSCPELDLLVELALSMPGVYGSRMTGAGFGGCTITLVRPDAVPALQEGVARRYHEETGIEPMVFATSAAAGADEVAA
ncbi:MAG: galactokinase [Armatimonadota bacterium]|nr:MAG: galactokinase [Armatimonadota bacterium]